MPYAGPPFGWDIPRGFDYEAQATCPLCGREVARADTPKGNRVMLDAEGSHHTRSCAGGGDHRRAEPEPSPPIISRTAPAPLREATDEAIAHGGSASGSVEWRTVAKAVLRELCTERETLTSDQFWDAMDGRWDRPSEPRWLGSVMQHARKQGWLRPTGQSVQSQRRSTAAGTRHHSAPVPLYRSLIHGGSR